MIFALTGYLNGWEILAGLATAAFIRTIHVPLAGRQRVFDGEVESFSQRFAEALVPIPVQAPLPHPTVPSGLAVELICNACRRAAARESLRLARGFTALRVIAVASPLFGLLGGTVGFVGTFMGASVSVEAWLAAVAWKFAEANIPIAWSLAVAIFACAGKRFLGSRLQDFKLEMESLGTSLSLALRR